MRLTLRTLLAWLDGVLPGDEQEELGRKVSSSVVATHLVERIRAAVNRTAIGAPRPDGRGLTEDPNSVAEYLDNTLSSDQLEAFERICIESEQHLAEVAACHGILAQLARDPAVEHGLHGDEQQRIQQRLRGLLAGLQDRAATEQAAMEAAGDGHRESRETARALREAMTATTSPRPATMADGAGGVSAQRQAERPAGGRSSLAAWAAAAVAVVLLLALAGVLAWSLVGKGGRRPPEVAMAPPKVEPPPAGADGPEDAVEESAVPEEVAGGMPADTQPPGSTEPGDEPGDEPQPTDEAKQPEGGADASAAASAPAAGAVAMTATAPAAGVMPAAQVPAAAAAQVPAQPAAATVAPPASVGFVGGEGVLLRLAETGDGTEWAVFPIGSLLGKREDILVPPASQPELHVRGVTIRLHPETRAALLVDADGTPRIEVVFGRVVARASQADAKLGVTAAGLVGTIDAGLLSPVGIEVELDRLTGADPVNTPPLVSSRITASGGVAWRQTTTGGLPAEQPLQGIDAQGLLDAGMTLAWKSGDPQRAALFRNRTLPAWIESGARLEKFEKAAGEALAAKVAATSPLSRALRELAADKRVENRMLAASTLALIGEFDDLVEQLSSESAGRGLSQVQWSQLESRTVPLALARGGNAASRLYDAFGNRGPHGKADVLWAMARGFTDEELAAGVARAVVEALDDPSLIVRRYAIKSLVEITRPSEVDRMKYRPDRPADMRREGVTWWRSQLDRGLIRRGADTTAEAPRPASRPGLPPESPAEPLSESPPEEE